MNPKTNLIFLLALALNLTACKSNFDPTPYNDALQNVRNTRELTLQNNQKWHNKLRDQITHKNDIWLNITTKQLLKDFMAKLQGRSADKKTVDVINPLEQHLYFPITQSQNEQAAAFNDKINKLNHKYAITKTIAGVDTKTTLDTLYYNKIRNKEDWQNYTPLQKETINTGIQKAEDLVASLPHITQLQEEHQQIITLINKQETFNKKLAQSHVKLEENTISALMASASALENNAWIASLLNKGMTFLNKTIGTITPEQNQSK